MKKHRRIAIPLALCLTVALTSCPNGPEKPPVTPVTPVDPAEPFEAAETSVEMAAKMAIGWNLGNTLDAGYEDSINHGLNSETYWGLPKTTQAMINAVAAKGFKTIRIPVSWHNHITDASNYTIDPKWMARVKEIVDWSIDSGMCVIINIHHDNFSISQLSSNHGFALSSDKDVKDKSKKFITSIWSQLCETFKDYDNNLVFEVLNEPRDISGGWDGNEWWTNNKAIVNCITEYEQSAIDTIRGTGGKNATRFIMVPGYAASGSDSSLLGLYTLPKDSATDRLMLSAHAYSPYQFAMYDDKGPDTTFDAADETSLTNMFNYLNTNYIKKGIGVVMGEASASDKNNLDERIKWAKYYFAKAHAIGIPVVLWDNQVTAKIAGTPNSGENHGYLNRTNLTWFYPTMIEAMMKAVYGASWEEGTPGTDTPSPETPSPEPEETDHGLLSEALDLSDSAWGVNTTINASAFSAATDSTKLVFTSTSTTVNDYINVKLQAADWSTVFDQGDMTGGSVGEGVLVPSSAQGTFTYKPTAEEWSEIKSKGLVVYGYGIKITKIVLE